MEKHITEVELTIQNLLHKIVDLEYENAIYKAKLEMIRTKEENTEENNDENNN